MRPFLWDFLRAIQDTSLWLPMDVCDVPPEDWPETLSKPFADVLNDPAQWAKKCVEQYGADMICLKLDEFILTKVIRVQNRR